MKQENISIKWKVDISSIRYDSLGEVTQFHHELNARYCIVSLLWLREQKGGNANLSPAKI
jgi:hypothetical protein